MNPENPAQPAPPAQQTNHPDIQNPIASMLPGEQNICQIARHPIGMIGIYIMAGFVLLVIAVVGLLVVPHLLSNYSKATVTQLGGLVFVVAAIFTAIFVFISNKIYWGNRWILTTDSLTQITQTSLFNKQSSQLSLGNLEDVTAEQNGLLTHMFNYGVLRVETAGERSKFMFLYCPNPNYYAQQVLGAREAFEQRIRQVGGVNQGNYPTAQPPAGYPPESTPPPSTDPDPDQGVNVGTE